ncbi:hypothetical protein PIROE2DRAFT_15211, partial [Piromyces sp. E2]
MNFKKFSLILSLLYLNQKVFSIPIDNESTTSIASLDEDVLESVVEDVEVNPEEVTALEDSSDDENVETKTVISETTTEPLKTESVTTEPVTTEPVIPVTGEECLTEECSEISKTILNKMDTSVNPCENFYQFTCGGWHDSNKNERNELNILKEQEKIINSELSELLKGDYIVNENLSKENQEYDRKTFDKMKTIYNSCKNIIISGYNIDVEKELLADFIKNFNIYKVEGENKLEKFTNLFIKLENAGLRIPFRFNNYSVIADSKIYSKFYSHDHSFNSDYLNYPELDSLFKEYIKKVLRIIYDNEQEVEEKAKIIYEVEKKIQSLQLSELSIIPNKKNQNEEITLNVIKQRYPFIDWELYLKKRIEFYGMECDNFDEVIFYDNNKNVREAINSYYNDIDFNDLATYMEWYNLLSLNEISEDIRNASTEIDEEFDKYDNSNFNEFPTDDYLSVNGDFLNNDLVNGEFPTDSYLSVDGDILNNESPNDEFNGDFNMDEIMKRLDINCAKMVSTNMPYALAKYYSDRKLSENVTNEIKQMIGYIKESMLERIPKLEWLDEETKQKAIEKLLKMKDVIGFKEKYDDPKIIYKLYEYLDFNNPLTTYLSNTLVTNGILLSNI